MLPSTDSSLLSDGGAGERWTKQVVHPGHIWKSLFRCAPYLCSKTDSSWREQTIVSSIASNPSYPAEGGLITEQNYVLLNKQWSRYKNEQIVRCSGNYLFVKPSSNHHSTVGVSLGSLTSFPKVLHLPIVFLFIKRRNNTFFKNQCHVIK